MKKIVFYSTLIIFATQTSFGADLRNASEPFKRKITYEDIYKLHQTLKEGAATTKYCEIVHRPDITYTPTFQRIKLEFNEWCFICIEDKNLREKIEDTFERFLCDPPRSYDDIYVQMTKPDADRRREARLAEQNPRCIENLILEACLMDLLEWAVKERDRNYFFQLKELFMAWMFDLDAIDEDYDFQKQLENKKGFFHRFFGF